MKISSLQTAAFDFQGREVRTLHILGQPWFVSKDVCDLLGIRNASDALTRLTETQKGVATTDTLGGKQTMAIVNESGIYRLIFMSRKPAARDFCNWVTDEVLPALRKTGFYALADGGFAEHANWELGRAKARIALLSQLEEIERDPKPGLEYLTLQQFLDRRGIHVEHFMDKLRLSSMLKHASRELNEPPVKQFVRRFGAPRTLWPITVLDACAPRMIAT